MQVDIAMLPAAFRLSSITTSLERPSSCAVSCPSTGKATFQRTLCFEVFKSCLQLLTASSCLNCSNLSSNINVSTCNEARRSRKVLEALPRWNNPTVYGSCGTRSLETNFMFHHKECISTSIHTTHTCTLALIMSQMIKVSMPNT